LLHRQLLVDLSLQVLCVLLDFAPPVVIPDTTGLTLMDEHPDLDHLRMAKLKEGVMDGTDKNAEPRPASGTGAQVEEEVLAVSGTGVQVEEDDLASRPAVSSNVVPSPVVNQFREMVFGLSEPDEFSLIYRGIERLLATIYEVQTLFLEKKHFQQLMVTLLAICLTHCLFE
jgi:hypothetical protein